MIGRGLKAGVAVGIALIIAAPVWPVIYRVGLPN